MHLKNIAVKNFRLLHDVNLLLEKKTTVIVGRNNSGKTSLTEVMKRLLTDGPSSFRLEDFSFAAHEGFWKAFLAASGGASDEEVRKHLPTIEIRLTFAYDTTEILGPLSPFIIDLNVDCTDACTISRNGPARFRVNGPTLHGLPAEPRFESSTRPFSLRQVFWL